MIHSAIVHHPLDPARYTVIATVGATNFLVAALAAAVQQPGRLTAGRLLNVLGTSLALPFGVGMQHFEDFPDRAAILIPAVLLLSFVAYTLKEARRPARRILGPLGLAMLVLTRAGYAGLRQVASGMPALSGGHHHGAPANDHSDEEDGHDHQHDQDSASPSGDPSAVPSVTPTPAGAASQKPAAASTSPSVPPHGSPGHHH